MSRQDARGDRHDAAEYVALPGKHDQKLNVFVLLQTLSPQTEWVHEPAKTLVVTDMTLRMLWWMDDPVATVSRFCWPPTCDAIAFAGNTHRGRAVGLQAVSTAVFQAEV